MALTQLRAVGSLVEGHADTESHTVSITPSRQFAQPFFFTPALLFGRSWAKQRTPWQRKINTENSPPTSGRSVCGSRSELVELAVVLVPHTYLLSTYPTTKCPHIRAHCYTRDLSRMFAIAEREGRSEWEMYRRVTQNHGRAVELVCSIYIYIVYIYQW